MRILIACPGAELGGCELYFLTLASALQQHHSVELLSALPAGSAVGNEVRVHSWPHCSSDGSCAGHAAEFTALLSEGYDRVVLVLNSPEPVAGPCFDPVPLIVAVSGRVGLSCLAQFVPSVLDLEPKRVTALRHVASRGAMACVSLHNRAALATALGVDVGRIAVIPNGVPSRDVRVAEVAAARRRLREGLRIDPDALIVVTHGRLVPSKRHEDLLGAAERLRATGLDVHFVWPGAGSGEAELRAQVSERGMTERVHFLGHLEDVTPLLLAADAAVFPSTEEGMSFSLLEAMAVGLPVVAARATSHPEVVQHGENGLLAEPGAGASYGDAIAEVLQDRRKATMLGIAAQEFQRRWCDASDALETAVRFLVPDSNT